MFPVLFSALTDPTKDAKPPLLLFNTLTRSAERFSSLHPHRVHMYNCGPTVYDYAHLGNLRSYVFTDVLRRILTLNEYEVTQVMNFTDVGHLAGDGDDGDDKMTIGLKREGLPLTLEGMRHLADRYIEAFLEDCAALNIQRPNALPRASEHVPAILALIETLMQKEYAYRTPDGVYFDTTRFTDYGKLGELTIDEQQAGARVKVNATKRNPRDFALWKRNDTEGWESPWGKGFPGWHIECSAMAMQYLGKELDIHTGGVDHIGTHHNNEIAQSEAATGKPFARVWMHNAHLLCDGIKFSKSLRNTITLRQLTEHGYRPLAYRYLLLTAHYRTMLNFSFRALDGAATALKRLHRTYAETLACVRASRVDRGYALRFLSAVNNDLDTPAAIALLWELMKDDTLTRSAKKATALHMDSVLAIGLTELTRQRATKLRVATSVAGSDLPERVRTLLAARQAARDRREWQRADELRAAISAEGYEIEDSADGPHVIPRDPDGTLIVH